MERTLTKDQSSQLIAPAEFYPTPYEQQVARFLGHGTLAFAFWKGRVALYAILKALGIGPNDEVIVPGYTCAVVPNAVRMTGAKPVYVDITPGTYNIDPELTSMAITGRTRAALVQHTYGIPARLDELLPVLSKRGVVVIEDCAHAFGTMVNGRHVGLWGEAAFFSSQWSKPYTTGLGGIAATRNRNLASKLTQVQKGFHQPPLISRLRITFQYLAYRQFFTPRLYWQAQSILHVLSRLGLFVGSSDEGELRGDLPRDHEWLMASEQQRFGMEQLKRARFLLENRLKLASLYDRELSKAGWQQTQRSPETVLLRYPLEVGNKEELLEKARLARVELGSWFETPLHPIAIEQHSIYDYTLGSCPIAENTARQTVNLPMHERVSIAEAVRVAKFVTQQGTPV